MQKAQSAEHGGNLVGSRIKVWSPVDKSYYEGVMESFDRSKMKHKVLYDHGDEDVALSIKDFPTHTLPIKNPSAQAPPRMSSQAPRKMVSASILEVICEVVNQTQTNDVVDTISEMEEMQCQVSAAEANKINVSWLWQHLNAIQKSTVKKEKCTLLMKGKAIISLVNKAAKRDFEKTRIELLTAQEQFRKAKRCVEIWKSRNECVFNDIRPCPSHTLSSFSCIDHDVSSLYPSSLPISYVSIVSESQESEIFSTSSPPMAELYAIRGACRQAVTYGWQNVVVESDSKVAISLACAQVDPPWSLSAICSRHQSMVGSLSFTVNLYHDGVFHVNPLECVNSDSKVKENQEKDKIGSKPDKNGKRGEAGKSLKQLQLKEEEKPKKTKKEWPKTHTRIKSY
uniref:RNase H type-1 domain-containing protein n=1 Tax=Tanacetum cinerariifolium TaxID=118510 RepID=A0A6L2M0U4_TANCI|nr:hypothetical protein [Tanacetum cinerariifolium]